MSRRLIIGVFAAVFLLTATGVAWFTHATWRSVDRVSIDAPDPSGGGPGAAPVEPGGEVVVTLPPSGDGIDVFLLVGSDSRDQLEDLGGFGSFEGNRADVVMVLIRPRQGDRGAALLSLPRDLWVADVCDGGEHRLNDALEGCEAMNGPTALTTTVEDIIGVPVDHFALVDLAGFQAAVDAIGGYEICVERPVRDLKSRLALPAGCTLASGAQTLAWVRSRSTEELTEDGWRVLPGMSDLVRNQRQRQFLVDMLVRLGDFTSPQDIASMARRVAPHVIVDERLSLLDAVGFAWTMRGLGEGTLAEIEVPVADHVTEHGASVLLAQVDVADLVADFVSPETAEGIGGRG